jgi:aminopeptidase YwaD
MKFLQALFAFLLFVIGIHAQDTAYARYVIRTLAGKDMQGRGYARHGDHKAAEFIVKELTRAGIKPIGQQFQQPFDITVNVFPSAMRLTVNHRNLSAGKDYLVDPASPSVKGDFIPVVLHLNDLEKIPSRVSAGAYIGKAVVIDLKGAGKEDKKNFEKQKQLLMQAGDIKVLIVLTDDKLMFSTSMKLASVPVILIRTTSLTEEIENIGICIKSKLIQDYATSNIAGFVRGTVYPDSFLVITAHYDHLGLMGKKTFFPGANDNASGAAMTLSVARYFSTHPQKYSVAFLFFSAEEAGLIGSMWFAEHPLIKLQNIKFLINLDLVGTGEEGITVVNATEFPTAFDKLTHLQQSALSKGDINKRDYACNSDQCSFYIRHVPCFYIYTRGGIAAYHDVYDKPETLPLTLYPWLTNLLIAFYEGF